MLKPTEETTAKRHDH